MMLTMMMMMLTMMMLMMLMLMLMMMTMTVEWVSFPTSEGSEVRLCLHDSEIDSLQVTDSKPSQTYPVNPQGQCRMKRSCSATCSEKAISWLEFGARRRHVVALAFQLEDVERSVVCSYGFLTVIFALAQNSRS